METDVGRILFGAATAALGLVVLAWGAFASVWQPVPPDLPGVVPLAYLAGALMLGCGIGLQFARTARPAAWILTAAYGVFAALWAVRVVRFPQLFGTWGGFAEQLSLAIAAVVLADQSSRREEALRRRTLCIKAYGVCAVFFGLNHFFSLGQTAGMVPRWLPPTPMFWAVATGGLFVAGGLALLADRTALLADRTAILAARVLGCMMLLIDAFVWLPQVVRAPGTQIAWAGNAVSAALAAAAFVIADAINARRALQTSQG